MSLDISEIRKSVAEFLLPKRTDGIVEFQRFDSWSTGFYQLVKFPSSTSPCYTGPIPDYTGCFDAIHAAIRSQNWTPEQQATFAKCLYMLQVSAGKVLWGEAQVVCVADPVEYAAAFLMTVNPSLLNVASPKRCPVCNIQLMEVRQAEGSLLNEQQWAAVRAGDYYCQNCPPDKDMRYKYWWKKEVKA